MNFTDEQAAVGRADELRFAFVVQRYGERIAGGSERFCRAIAERLAKRASVTVLTTCATDYISWRDELAPGESELNGVRLLRFRVDSPRVVRAFNRLSEKVLNSSPPIEEQERWMRMQGPVSTALLEHLRREGENYEAVLFFTYLYATTYFGLPLVASRALLAPTAHDEPAIYLPMFDGLFRQARRLLFLTPEEHEFVYRRFCLPEEAGAMAGFGMDAPGEETALPEAVRAIGGAPYLLYVGRVDPSKGCEELVKHFLRFVKETPESPLRLVLAGAPYMKIPKDPRVIATGYVSEAEKNGLLAGAMALAAPSPYESLCIAALEAWLRDKPVVANGVSKVLVGQCQRASGGVWYRNYAEFAECVRVLEGDAELRRRLGEAGRRYTQRNYGWERVEQVYFENLSQVARG
jgi:glycosyltransferase involved in cell wall biosynthesis